MSRPLSILIPVAAALLCLAGCDPLAQARNPPTSVEDIFGPFNGVSGVEAEVLELPATPPAIGQVDAANRTCRPPGLVMKPTDMVGISNNVTSYSTSEPTAMSGSYEPPLPSPPPGPAHRIASWYRVERPGAKESIATPAFRPQLEAGRSIYRAEPTRIGGYRTDVYSWCEPDANQRR